MLWGCARRFRRCIVEDQGVPCLRIHGKGDTSRLVALSPAATTRLSAYLEAAGHKEDLDGPLVRPVRSRKATAKYNVADDPRRPLHPDTIWRNVVKKYAKQLGYKVSPHTMRHTAGTNALNHGADFGEVQKWLGHSDVSTTQTYDHRDNEPENSPSFKVDYGGRKRNGTGQNGEE